MKLNTNQQLKTTLQAICRQPGKIAILTHQNPDGDGLAAALALKSILKKMGYESDIILEKAAPAFLDFLQVKDHTMVLSPEMSYQIVILLDCHEPERTGACSELADKSKALVAIDHHEPRELNPHWYYFIKPEDVSTGATLFKTFKHEIGRMKGEQKRYVTDCIYTTILNDTDGFMNNNTDSEVFKVCADLAEMGTSPAEVMEKFILNNSPAKLKLVGSALQSIQTYRDGKILFMYTTLEQLAENKLDQDATSKITKWVKGSTGVEVFIYARETGENEYRLSLRSSSVDCNLICGKFGGGGHISASGCVINKSLAETRELVIEEVQNQLDG